MAFDHEIGYTEEIINKVESTRDGLVLIKQDIGCPGDKEIFSNPHASEFFKIFGQERVKQYREYYPITYRYRNKESLLVGYCVYAGEDPYSIDPWISVEQMRNGKITPVHIFRIQDGTTPGTHKVKEWVVQNGHTRKSETRLPGRIDTFTLQKSTENILRFKTFPQDFHDPFLIMAKAKRMV
jgi:hypothetical protein